MTDEERRDSDADPGAFIGTGQEWAADTIPDGPQPGDERVAGEATQSSGEGAAERRLEDEVPPEGHREGAPADSDEVRRAGQNL